jgi:hypothetical protein
MVWSRRKKRVTVGEFLRWQERAYPPGADSASATLFRERPILIDVIHAICHQGLRQPASIAGQSPLAVIHSCLGVEYSQSCLSAETVYGDIRRLEFSHPAAFRWLFGAALAYTGRGWRE